MMLEARALWTWESGEIARGRGPLLPPEQGVDLGGSGVWKQPLNRSTGRVWESFVTRPASARPSVRATLPGRALRKPYSDCSLVKSPCFALGPGESNQDVHLT